MISPSATATRPRCCPTARRFTYRELAARSNRYARWALAQGLRKGDIVCLLMPSRPEFLAIWVGITRAGGVVALLNTHLTGPALAYCINVVNPQARHRRRRAVRALASPRAHHVTGDARSGCTATPTPISRASTRDRRPFRRQAGPPPIACPDHRGRRALHLHVRHDRACRRRPTSITTA